MLFFTLFLVLLVPSAKIRQNPAVCIEADLPLTDSSIDRLYERFVRKITPFIVQCVDVDG